MRAHINVDLHAVALGPVQRGRGDHQGVFGDEVADAANAPWVVEGIRLKIELERLGACEQQRQRAEDAQ